jgi:hypothetical protein
LQSVPTHNKNLYSIKIKKGTLIIVDINERDYQGRITLPECFMADNRIKVKPLISNTKSDKLKQEEL